MKIYDAYVSMTNGKVHRNITQVSPVHTIDNETHWISRYIYLNRNTNIKSEMRSFKSNENIHKKKGGSYYVVSANKASSVTL